MWRRIRVWMKVVETPAFRLGLAVGVVGLLGGWALVQLHPGRLPGNPMPVVLALSAIGRALGQGLAYFNWQAPALHLAFVGLLASASAALTAASVGARSGDAKTAARTAVGLNLVVSGLLEVDALMVLLFYVGASFLSLSAAGLAAHWTAQRLRG